MSTSRHRDAIGPIQLARQSGTTIKALRCYELRGLMRPKRTARGWRVYRPQDVERLTQILALKRMGFGLTEIAMLLDATPADFAAALCAQESRLLQQREALDATIRTLRQARRLIDTRAANEDDIDVRDHATLAA